MVMCTLVGPRCMWCCMGAVWREGVWGVGVVSVFGVYRDRANWCSRAAPSCKAVGKTRDGV